MKPYVVDRPGIEPRTWGLWVDCSSYWANGPNKKEKRKNIGRGPTVPNSTDSNKFEFRIIYSSHNTVCKFRENIKK